jgi:cardiolipin synthase
MYSRMALVSLNHCPMPKNCPISQTNSSSLQLTPDSKPPPKAALAKRILPAVVHENIYTLPNILTFSRLAAAPVVGYLILHDQLHYALGLFVYAGITDFVDGYLARRWNQRTVVGSVVDPMADKLLMTISTVTLTIQGSMPLYLAVIILGRDIGLAISAIYYRYISLPPPKTFTRYWDFSLPSAEVRPTEISKWNTFFQIALIGWTVAMPALRGWGAGLEVEAALVGFQYFTAATTVWSGASYLYTKDAVRILGQDEAKEKEVEKKDEHEIK